MKQYRVQIIISAQVGDAEERASGAAVVGAAGEEAAQFATSRRLPTLPHYGNKSKASRESTQSWAHLCVRAAPRYSSKLAADFQHGE